MKKLLLTAIVLAGSFSGFAIAQGVTLKPDDVIAARQGGMALVGGLAEAMKAGVASGAEVKPFQAGAEAMAEWGEGYAALYPDGTQKGHDTKAKAEIWTDRAGFEKANANWIAAAKKLGEAAKAGDKTVFAAAFKEMGGTCGACHKAYKARD